LLIALLMLSTWKQLVKSLYVGLSGREWAVKASVLGTLTILFALGPVTRFVLDRSNALAGLFRSLPWILGVLACAKTGAALWVVGRLGRSRLLGDGALLEGAAIWAALVLALHGLLAWLVPMPPVPRYVLGLLAILAVPFVRLSAAAP